MADSRAIFTPYIQRMVNALNTENVDEFAKSTYEFGLFITKAFPDAVTSQQLIDSLILLGVSFKDTQLPNLKLYALLQEAVSFHLISSNDAQNVGHTLECALRSFAWLLDQVDGHDKTVRVASDGKKITESKPRFRFEKALQNLSQSEMSAADEVHQPSYRAITNIVGARTMDYLSYEDNHVSFDGSLEESGLQEIRMSEHAARIHADYEARQKAMGWVSQLENIYLKADTQVQLIDEEQKALHLQRCRPRTQVLLGLDDICSAHQARLEKDILYYAKRLSPEVQKKYQDQQISEQGDITFGELDVNKLQAGFEGNNFKLVLVADDGHAELVAALKKHNVVLKMREVLLSANFEYKNGVYVDHEPLVKLDAARNTLQAEKVFVTTEREYITRIKKFHAIRSTSTSCFDGYAYRGYISTGKSYDLLFLDAIDAYFAKAKLNDILSEKLALLELDEACVAYIKDTEAKILAEAKKLPEGLYAFYEKDYQYLDGDTSKTVTLSGDEAKLAKLHHYHAASNLFLVNEGELYAHFQGNNSQTYSGGSLKPLHELLSSNLALHDLRNSMLAAWSLVGSQGEYCSPPRFCEMVQKLEAARNQLEHDIELSKEQIAARLWAFDRELKINREKLVYDTNSYVVHAAISLAGYVTRLPGQIFEQAVKNVYRQHNMPESFALAIEYGLKSASYDQLWLDVLDAAKKDNAKEFIVKLYALGSLASKSYQASAGDLAAYLSTKVDLQIGPQQSAALMYARCLSEIIPETVCTHYDDATKNNFLTLSFVIESILRANSEALAIAAGKVPAWIKVALNTELTNFLSVEPYKQHAKLLACPTLKALPDAKQSPSVSPKRSLSASMPVAPAKETARYRQFIMGLDSVCSNFQNGLIDEIANGLLKEDKRPANEKVEAARNTYLRASSLMKKLEALIKLRCAYIYPVQPEESFVDKLDKDAATGFTGYCARANPPIDTSSSELDVKEKAEFEKLIANFSAAFAEFKQVIAEPTSGLLSSTKKLASFATFGMFGTNPDNNFIAQIEKLFSDHKVDLVKQATSSPK